MEIIDWSAFVGRVSVDLGSDKEWCWDLESPWQTSGFARIAVQVGFETARLGEEHMFCVRLAVFSPDRVPSENPGAYLV